MKKILAVIVFCVLAVGLACVANAAEVASGTCGAGLKWVLDASGTLTIAGNGEMYDYEYGTAPWNSYKENILSVKIDNGIKTIGDFVFYGCHTMEAVTFPESLISIGNYAFSECKGLEYITIPSNLESIGVGAFRGCGFLTGITVDEYNLNFVSENGVLFDKTMETLLVYPIANEYRQYYIPDGVTTVAYGAFHNAYKLEALYIPSSVTSIPEMTIAHCGNLKSIVVDKNNQYYTSLNGVLFDKNMKKLLSYPPRKQNTTYEIPNSVTEICEAAFSSCSLLTSITVPDGVTSIAECAFQWCNNMSSISIPKSVTSIGGYAFSYCDSLTDIYYAGSESEWNAIVIDVRNDSLNNATVHYASEGDDIGEEKSPDLTGDGNTDSADLDYMADCVIEAMTGTLDSAESEKCDLNSDGKVGLLDLHLLVKMLTE